MNYLLDTNHWSYLQRDTPTIVSQIQNLPAEATIYMPVVSQAELLAGVALTARKQRKQQLQNLYEQVVTKATTILPITSQVAQQYATIFVGLRRKGKPIPTNDIWIAAIARAYNLILVSNDEHFQYVDKLQVENWL